MRIGWIASTVILVIVIILLGITVININSRVETLSNDVTRRIEHLEAMDQSNQSNIQDLYDMFATHGFSVPAGP